MGNHHYLIAHRVVPSFFFQGPQQFMDITIRTPGRVDWEVITWITVADDQPKS